MITLADTQTSPFLFDFTNERERLIGPWRRTAMAIKGIACRTRRHGLRINLRARQVTLRCATCGYESPGWQLGPDRPTPRFAGEPDRHTTRLQATNRPDRWLYRGQETTRVRPRHARRPEAL